MMWPEGSTGSASSSGTSSITRAKLADSHCKPRRQPDPDLVSDRTLVGQSVSARDNHDRACEVAIGRRHPERILLPLNHQRRYAGRVELTLS